MQMKKYISLSVLAMLSTSVLADECLYPHQEPIVIGDGSVRVTQQQAKNTWDDWIWRGPTFACPSVGDKTCMYQWSKAETTGYSWSVGGTLNLDKLPVVGKYLPGSIKGSYEKKKSLTTTFGWTVTLNAGYSAQPIQVVVRRWMRGVYRGAYIHTGGKCGKTGSGVIGGIGIPHPAQASMYHWDPNRIASSWVSNIEQRTYATYHVFK